MSCTLSLALPAGAMSNKRNEVVARAGLARHIPVDDLCLQALVQCVLLAFIVGAPLHNRPPSSLSETSLPQTIRIRFPTIG